MLLQVHDELILEVPATEAKKTLAVVQKTMEESFKINNISISVPLNAEGGKGDNWAQAH